MTGRCRRRISVHGVVQGVGFRPFAYAAAAAAGLSGSVRNDSSGAIIEVEGAPDAVNGFLDRLRRNPPPLAVIESVEVEDIPTVGHTGFHISDTSRSDGGRTLVSPDIAMCADCAAELCDPANRRYRHAFVNCTNCGPRFTIISALPYDRSATTMAGFPMCRDCATEYADPNDRRFHAQPVCCPNCGPTITYRARNGQCALGGDGLRNARQLLRDGGILAVKGIGGYHLACDAGNDHAVRELRRRKQRGDKPFAVMVADLATARTLCGLSERSERLLSGLQRPIVLMERSPTAPVAASVAPHNPDLGVMLAYTPLHSLLFGLEGDEPGPRVLVMTSGNRGGEPICYDDDDAAERLSPLTDGWLLHDREILVPCDDSVVRALAGSELPIRRSRGYAPLPVALPVAVQSTLAVGADVKNTMALAEGQYAWLSQHIGDMDDLATLSAFDSAASHLSALTGVRPEIIVTDAHPGYRSTSWARRNAHGRPVRPVQHHHAHIAAVMAEHGLDGSDPVLGFAFDGTGLGPDGAVWGGEVLLSDYKGFRRLAQLKYVRMPGGDVSVLRPYRMAMTHLWAAGVPWVDDLPPVRACPIDERGVLLHQLKTGLGCLPTSSMGRLFDAVSALAGVRQVVDYEAQAAIELEGLSRAADPGEVRYRFDVTPDVGLGADPDVGLGADPDVGLGADPDVGLDVDSPAQIDPAPLLRAVVDDVRDGLAPGVIGARFHAAVAQLIIDLAAEFATDSTKVALSGGVFQNALLLRHSLTALNESGFTAITHRHVPPNDGGIALGQLMVGNSA